MEGMAGVQTLRVTVHGRISAAADDFLRQVEKRRAPVPVLTLRAMLTERLMAAAEEIVGVFKRALAERERMLERSERDRRLLDAALKPRVALNRVDFQQQLRMVIKEDPPEQEQWSPLKNEEASEPPLLMEEPNTLCMSLGEQQHEGSEETDVATKICKGEEKPFCCTKCDKKYIFKNSLKNHMLVHREEKPFCCLCCGKRFRLMAAMKLHVRIHKQFPVIKCSVCGRGFTRKSSLIRHMRLVHTLKNPVIVNKEYPPGQAQQHQSPAALQDHSEPPFSKDEPNTVLMSQETDSGSNGHLQLGPEDKMESCSQPDSNEDVRQEIREHQATLNPGSNSLIVSVVKCETGQESFICSLCDHMFTVEQLQEHLSVHMREEPLVGKDLRNHISCWTARRRCPEKRFSCTECNKSYSSKNVLRKHMLVHTGEGPFNCTECGKKYDFQNSLKKHMLVHRGEEPFSCPQCGRRFISSNHLKKHMLIHTGEKPFRCHCCSKRFGLKYEMQEHLTLHARSNGCNCSVCGKWFTRKSSMDRHYRYFHAEENLMIKEADPSDAQKQSPAVDQEDSELPYFKAEPNTILISQEEQQLQGLDETDVKFILTSVGVKSEEEEPQSSQLHQCDTGEIRVKCGETEAAADSGSNGHLQPGPEDKMESSSGPVTDGKEDVKQEIREHQASLNPGKEVMKGETDQETFICSLCNQTFTLEEDLELHLLVHVGQKPLSFPNCGQVLSHQNEMDSHSSLQEKQC